MKRRKLLPAGLSFVAVLGLFAGAGLPSEAIAERASGPTGVSWRAAPGSEFVATPIPAASVAAVELPPLHPCLSDVEGPVPHHGWGREVRCDVRPGGERQAVLVSAQVFEKYRSFRESLSTP